MKPDIAIFAICEWLQGPLFFQIRKSQKRARRPFLGPFVISGINIPKRGAHAAAAAQMAVMAICPQKKGQNRPVATSFRHGRKMAVPKAWRLHDIAINATSIGPSATGRGLAAAGARPPLKAVLPFAEMPFQVIVME